MGITRAFSLKRRTWVKVKSGQTASTTMRKSAAVVFPSRHWQRA
jgi:hypothetical protein